MTGYGRGVVTASEYAITIDIKSINHRFLETYFKLPKVYSFLEDRLRREISSRLSRGKIELIINIDKFIAEENLVEINKPLAASYIKAIHELKSEFVLDSEIDLSTLLRFTDIFKIAQPEEDQEKLAELATEALASALSNLIETRKLEGDRLVSAVRERVGLIDEMRLKLIDLAPQVVINYQEKLSKRITELLAGVEPDQTRLATEIAIFADKSDISEELVRIESHLHQFLSTLQLSEPIGRKLDFLIQELNREINTVGSKANELKISQIVIEFKAELEKIREQIQNIE